MTDGDDRPTARAEAPIVTDRGDWVRIRRSDWAVLAVAALITLPLHAAMVTDNFKVSLWMPDGPSHYFDAYAKSLSEGRLDIDPYHIGNEAFLIGDRAYGYWGLMPAVLRLPLNALFPSRFGQWSRIMLLLAAVITLAGTHALLVCLRPPQDAGTQLARAIHVGFLVTVGAGSSCLFMASRPNVYHEANALGTSLAIAGYAALAAYLAKPSFARVGSLLALCALALHARVVAGIGLVIAIGVSLVWMALRAWGGRLPAAIGRVTRSAAPTGGARHAVVLAAGLAAVLASYVAVNWLKFGTMLSIPINLNLQSTPERLARTGGKMVSLRNLPANLYNHLMPLNLRLGTDNGMVGPVPPGDLFTTAGMDYDWREPIVSITAASPALSLLAVFGAVALLRGLLRGESQARWLPLLAGSAASAGVPLVYFAITQRYANDMLPFLTVAGALAVARVASLPRARQVPIAALAAPLTLWGVFTWWQVGDNYRAWARDTKIWPVRDAVMVPAYERQARLHPEDLTAQYELALIRQQAGQTEQARTHALRALELDPSHVPSLILLAGLDRQTQPSKAAELLAKAVKSEPNMPGIRVMLAHALLAAGRAGQAAAELRIVLRMAPGDRRAKKLLVQALANQ